MADKVPVQDKLSQILAELMWCLAGTEEDDEYAGQVYMEMEEHGNDGFFEDEDGDVIWTEVLENDSDDEGDENEYDDDDENAWQDMPSDDDDVDNVEDDSESESEEDAEDQEGDRIESINEPHCRGAHLVSLYVGTFLRTVKREWGNVDKHRVDKFYTAVRLMIREVSVSIYLYYLLSCCRSFSNSASIGSNNWYYLISLINTWPRDTGT